MQGLLCNNIDSTPMPKRLFDNSIHRFPHSHIAKQSYGVFVLPACELLRVVCLGPAHRRNFVSMRGYCSDYRTTQMACRSEYLLGIRRKLETGQTHTIQTACSGGFPSPGGSHVAGSLMPAGLDAWESCDIGSAIVFCCAGGKSAVVRQEVEAKKSRQRMCVIRREVSAAY